MKNFIYTLLTVLLILLIYSCGKKLLGEYYLSDKMKAQIPFRGQEKITFIDENQNSYTLQSGDKFNEIYEYQECNSCKDYSIFEREWIIFSDALYELLLKISSGKGLYVFSISYSYNDIGFRCTFKSPLSKDNLRDNEIYYDSLILNNKTYYKIFSDTLTHNGMIEIAPYPVRCYYSTEYGVVKIDFSDSTSWELDHIEW